MTKLKSNHNAASILVEIVENRRQCLIEKPLNIELSSLEKSNYSLVDALSSSETGFIFECKKRSPSRGLLSDDYKPDQIAATYEPFASAISVLTEPDYFAGSMQDLQLVRSKVNLPILCKDFVIDTSQIFAARDQGADVILLMLSVVSDDFWLECFEIAEQLRLDIITEVSNQSELDRALKLPTKIIGINNRDLHTLKTDISKTLQLAKQIPPDRLTITESGLSTHQQLKTLAPLVHGFLIGSSLMQSDEMETALRKLIYGQIKVCGLCRRQDADLAWLSGASYGGVIFTQRSSRAVSLQQAMLICEDQPMPMVGVFLNQTIEELVTTAKELDLKAIQLHGDETLEYLEQLQFALKGADTGCEIWKAISCSEVLDAYPSVKDAQQTAELWFSAGVTKVIIDTPKGFPKIKNHKLDYTVVLTDRRFLLAGSLSTDDVDALQEQQLSCCEAKIEPAGFDLCSSLELTQYSEYTSESDVCREKDVDKIGYLFATIQPKTKMKQQGLMNL